MAARNGNGNKAHQVQVFVREQMEEAQKRILAIEGEAKKALETLVEKGRESRKDLEGMIKRFNAKDLKFLENPSAAMKQFSKKAEAAGLEMKKRFDALQGRVIEFSGVASQAQIKEMNRELHRLAKKVDTLLDKKGKPEARA
ncbi:MAG TPA: hypothetical protein VND93_24505 [Myxococcales bacterium]|nr:hypothetical protein [Myxococcales bacterium]